MSAAVASVRWSVETGDPEETAAIGEALGRTAPDGAVILLEGPLGAGKTTFAQGVGAGCGVREPITSPTYNLVLQYEGRRPFTHVDLYRLGDESELNTLDLEELLGASGVSCVEWPELLGSSIALPAARISLQSGRERSRTIRGELAGDGWRPALATLVARGCRLG